MTYEREQKKRTAAIIKPLLDGLNSIPRDSFEDEFILSFYAEEESLRRCIDTWIEAGCHFGNWSTSNPNLYAKIKRFVEGYECNLAGGGDHRAVVSAYPTEESRHALEGSLELRAVESFLKIIRSSLFSAIGKCERCGKYFLNTFEHKDKKYCSRACASGDSAHRAMQAKREREREEKIKKARKAIRELKEGGVETPDWKSWVVERTGLTRNWITYAVNTGDLKIPKVLLEKEKK